MNIFDRMKAKKRIDKILSICTDLTIRYESRSKTIVPSCKDELSAVIRERLNCAKTEIANWDDQSVDYIRIAHTMLVDCAFDLLASGRFHLHYGILNPMNCSSKLMTVYEQAMQYAVNTGEITSDTKEKQLALLAKCISEVG
ncbi:MAG: hypothetical protein IKT57_00225 [Clostridia bacterium]|nr:hypothetical protein [Clostridia bacterium]